MTHVIILAGGSIKNKLGFLHSRCESPALIPVNTRPLAAYLVDFYSTQPGSQICLVVNAEVADTVRAELGGLREKYSLLALGKTAGVVDSLAQAMVNIPNEADVIVNLVTTIPTRLVQPGEVLLASEASQTGHWSGVILDGGKAEFSFKAAPLAQASHAFTGVFRCQASVLKSAIQSSATRTDLLAVIAQIQQDQPWSFTAGDWIDCGHETNYYEAKAKLISSRSFNRIHVSLDDGVLSKQSEHGEKLAREIEYVKMLPAAIQVYYPRVLGWQPASGNRLATVQMEYYGYPSVAEYYLFWELSPDNWRRLFSRLQTALRRFHAFPYSIGPAAFAEFYLDKTIQRVEQYLAALNPQLRQILEKETVINGRRCKPLSALTADLRARLTAMYRDKDFCVMHGDFCFNNLLYDVPSGIVRLIDPRGSFGEQCIGIYGDQKYDLAKLKHSAEHGYDFLVNGLFTLKENGSAFDYAIAARECSPLVAELCHDLITGLGHDNREIELLTSLLFLSMCPLHAEDAKRQLAMYAHGLNLLNTCLEN